jgi:NTP pyrophosphatase (non-canonical NTP hydrolase)
MKEDLLNIIKHYGVMTQLKYFQSEVFELNEAIINHEIYFNHYDDLDEGIGAYDFVKAREHIAEEIADVLVMIFQFKEYYSIDDYDIEKVMHQKTKRQLDRIKKEQ